MSSSEWTNPWTGEKAIELVWFHLVAIEAIWATGQLTTKICNWDRLFFLKHFECFFLFGCWLFGNVLASSFGHLHQPLFSSQRAVLSQLKCAQRACEIFWDFKIQKWPLNLSQKMAEKNMSLLINFGLVWVVLECCMSMFEAFWLVLRLKKKLLKILHFLKAISSRRVFCLWNSHQLRYFSISGLLPRACRSRNSRAWTPPGEMRIFRWGTWNGCPWDGGRSWKRRSRNGAGCGDLALGL